VINLIDDHDGSVRLLMFGMRCSGRPGRRGVADDCLPVGGF
jgi:hypothetical protein